MSDYNDLDMMIDFHDPKRYVDGCKCDPSVNHTCELCMTYNTLREAKRMLMVRDAEIERLQKDRSRSENELDRLREWVAAVEDGYDKQKAEIERLRGDAASLAVAREQLLVQADEIKRLLRSHYKIERLRAELRRVSIHREGVMKLCLICFASADLGDAIEHTSECPLNEGGVQ